MHQKDFRTGSARSVGRRRIRKNYRCDNGPDGEKQVVAARSPSIARALGLGPGSLGFSEGIQKNCELILDGLDGLVEAIMACNCITEYQTKTVGAGKDFADINEALLYAQKSICIGPGVLKLVLDPGVHKIKSSPDSQNTPTAGWGFYYVRNMELIIEGSTSDASQHIITIDKDEPLFGADDYPSVINLSEGSHVQFTRVHLDSAADGYPYPGNIWSWAGAWMGGMISAYFVMAANAGAAFSVYHGGNLRMASCTLRDHASYPLDIYNGVEADLGPTITFSGNAADIYAAANVRVLCYSNVNITPPFPFNTWQPDGSIILDNTTGPALMDAAQPRAVLPQRPAALTESLRLRGIIPPAV